MEGLGFNAGVHGIASSFCFNEGIENRKQPARVSALGRSANCNLVESSSRKKVSSSRSSSLMNSLRSVWHNGEKENGVVSVSETCVADVKEDEVVVEEEEEKEEEEEIGLEERKGNWILKILQIRSAWKEKSERNSLSVLDESSNGSCSCDDSCDNGDSKAFAVAVNDKEEEKEEEEKFNRDSFSRLLRRVSLTEAILYARLSYLGHLAYSIPKIKPENLLKYHRLRFITSSIEKKAQAMNSEQKEQTSTQILEAEDKPNEAVKEDEEQKKTRSYGISASAAYQIAASAASYLQNCTQSILPFKSPETKIREGLAEGCNGNAEIEGSEAASFVATTNSLTAVVAAKEEMKQAVAKDLNSIHSSPCDWFICDDDQSGTRIFVIQGSESLASWQANLLFEPIHFEGLDVLVHRGIYEAAKGIYEQILPEVHAHLKARESATLCFTGHSLGGSLSLLINLMLLIRGEVTVSSLLPVVTFGAPTIMCGGDQLLRRLGLPRNHVQTITMHRDIVPRAFACSYPSRVVELLRAVNSNFRNHPCLCNQKFLYAPMGDILILQPDEKISPQHDLLPPGIGLYYLTDHISSGSGDPEKKLLAAQITFLNSPHPLEILSDRSAYGSSGAICRDHDMRSYLRSVRSVIRRELKRIEKEREHARQVWWPFFSSQSVHSNNIYVSGWMASSNVTPPQLKLSSIFQTGKESWKRVRRLIASQNIHLLAVLLFPTRVSFFSAHTFMGFY